MCICIYIYVYIYIYMYTLTPHKVAISPTYHHDNLIISP